MATDSLNKKYKTNINVEQLSVTIFGDVKLKKVMIRDHHKDTLIYAKRIQTDILSYRKLLKADLLFGDISIDSLFFNLKTYKMKNITLITAISITLGFSACSQTNQNQSNNQNKTIMETTNKQKVVALLKSIETGDTVPVSYINPNKYIQHNLGAADGLAGFGALLQTLPKGSAKVNTVRAFQDGNFVFTHTEYDFFGPKIGFDIFRFEDGKIVEHWDILQAIPENSINPHPMF